MAQIKLLGNAAVSANTDAMVYGDSGGLDPDTRSLLVAGALIVAALVALNFGLGSYSV